jgi:hypothetical protein
MNYRNSLIDAKWLVVMIDVDDEYYKKFSEAFNKFGLAIGDLKNLTTYIDGNQFNKLGLNEDHIYAIEAHEISHYILDHSAFLQEINIDEEQLEREADFAAYKILLKLKQKTAAELIKQRYLEYYDEQIHDFPIKPSQLLKIQKYLNEIKNV